MEDIDELEKFLGYKLKSIKDVQKLNTWSFEHP